MKINNMIVKKDVYLEGKNGETLFNEEAALAHMLLNGELISSQSTDETVELRVVCNDIFAFACVDAEKLPYSEIRSLYEMWRADKYWGIVKWCILKRKLMPQKSVLEAMKRMDAWNLDENQLEKNDR